MESIINIFTISKDAFAEDKYLKRDLILLDGESLKDSLILLDGYDEAYLSLKEREITIYNFFEKLVEFSKKWNSKFIVTSRKTCIDDSDLYRLYNGIYETDSDEDILEENKIQICQLALLTEQQQKDWVNFKYNKLFPQNKYNIEQMYNLHKKDNKQSKILELLRIPILLQLIVSEDFYGNAKNNAELYAMLFKKILSTRKETTRNKKQHFKRIFESFAYNIYKNNDTYTLIESKDLEENENEKWKAVLLFYIKNIKSNQQNKYYIEFVHRSFYQYFQAWHFYRIVLDIAQENHKIELKIKKNSNKYAIQDKQMINDLFTIEIKVANLFEAICERKLEKDVIDMIGQISQNQKDIQKQEQINFILDIFEKTDGFIKRKNNNWYIPIGQLNILDGVENIIYNLLMILNIILPRGLILSEKSRIEQLMKKFDISDIYLPNINMSGLNLTRVNLKEACLKKAYLQGTTLEDAYLEKAHLEKAHLEEAHLTRAHLTRAHLEEAHLTRAHLEEADLRRAYLEEADLIGAHLTETHLEGAHLIGAHLRWSHLERSHLEGIHLEGADLEGAHLEEADLRGAYLEKTHLEKVDLRKAIFNPIILTDAILENTKISKERYDEIVALEIDINKIIWCD